MEPIEIYVAMVPVAQPRQRHRIMQPKDGKAFVANYTPARAPVQEFKLALRQAASEVYSGPPLAVALRVDCEFVFPRPQSIVWKRRPMPRLAHTKKPDVDNVLKSVLDCLSEVTWARDQLVANVCARKWYAAGDERPHCRITITEVKS